MTKIIVLYTKNNHFYFYFIYFSIIFMTENIIILNRNKNDYF